MALSERTCLEVNGRLSDRDRQKHHPFAFRVAPGVERLRIRFRFVPGRVGTHRNILTLTVFDPLGFRGAAHRWNADQEIFVAPRNATPGFFPGPVWPGEWRIEIDTHEILNDGDTHGWCNYELNVVAQARGQDGDPGPRPGGPQPSSRGGIRAVAAPLGPLDAPDALDDLKGLSDARRRLPDAARVHARPGWYKGDLHSHCVHCDGESQVNEMAQAAANRGLDFLAITCHNTTSWLTEAAQWPAQLLRVRGMECTTYFGHANILGATDWIDWRTQGPEPSARSILEQARRQGALFVVNHPCAAGNPVCTGCRWEYVDVGFDEVDCVEVWNRPWHDPVVRNPAALKLWTDLLDKGLRVAAVAGTDNHRAARYRSETGLPFTWVYLEGLGERELLQALRRGRAFLSSGPELYFTARTPGGFETSLPGTQIAPAEPFSLTVNVRELATPATLWLVCDGLPCEPRHLQPPGAEVRIDRVVSRRWCRLELWRGRHAGGDLLAVTNPLYVA